MTNKLQGRDLLEEMQWKYAGGPLPSHRRRKVQRTLAAGCVARFIFWLCLATAIIVAAKLILGVG